LGGYLDTHTPVKPSRRVSSLIQIPRHSSGPPPSPLGHFSQRTTPSVRHLVRHLLASRLLEHATSLIGLEARQQRPPGHRCKARFGHELTIFSFVLRILLASTWCPLFWPSFFSTASSPVAAIKSASVPDERQRWNAGHTFVEKVLLRPCCAGTAVSLGVHVGCILVKVGRWFGWLWYGALTNWLVDDECEEQ